MDERSDGEVGPPLGDDDEESIGEIVGGQTTLTRDILGKKVEAPAASRYDYRGGLQGTAEKTGRSKAS